MIATVKYQVNSHKGTIKIVVWDMEDREHILAKAEERLKTKIGSLPADTELELKIANLN